MTYPIKEWKSAKRGYRFGEPTFYSPHHLGVDHCVPIGTPIVAPYDCEIVYAGTRRDGGKTIWISFTDAVHGVLITRFMHLSKMMPVGKYHEGEVIGYSGNTGKLTTAPHLHTDISKGSVKIKDFNNFIDPEKYFNKIKLQPAVAFSFAQDYPDTDDAMARRSNMMTYKKEGEDKIYARIGDVLIPFDISLETYRREFGGVEVVVLSEDEFGKFRVVEGVGILEKE